MELILIIALLGTSAFFYLRWQNERQMGRVARMVYDSELQRRDEKLRAQIPFGEGL